MPPETPVVLPLEDPTAAIAVLELVQVPPGEADESDTMAPSQKLSGPVMGAGEAITVTTR